MFKLKAKELKKKNIFHYIKTAEKNNFLLMWQHCKHLRDHLVDL